MNTTASRLHPPRRPRLVLRLRRPEVSLRFDRRGLVALTITALAALAAVVLTIVVGRLPVPLGEVIPTLLGHGSATNDLVINTLRLPRVLVLQH